MGTLPRRAQLTFLIVQKKKNQQSGTEFQKTKEAQAAIMRQKQEAGELADADNLQISSQKKADGGPLTAAAKKAGEDAGGVKNK